MTNAVEGMMNIKSENVLITSLLYNYLSNRKGCS
jgi:hypothetical protein